MLLKLRSSAGPNYLFGTDNAALAPVPAVAAGYIAWHRRFAAFHQRRPMISSSERPALAARRRRRRNARRIRQTAGTQSIPAASIAETVSAAPSIWLICCAL